MGLQENLVQLCTRARELGADRAVAMLASDVVVDDRVRMKCLVPRCEHYGNNLMCPPNLPSVDEFRKALSLYKIAILVQCRIENIPMPEGKELTQLAIDKSYRAAMAQSMKAMSEILSAMEKECLGMGYRFAMGLGGGACAYCAQCVGPGGTCRHPFKARPSIEAMGVDVVATAAKAGAPVQFPAKEEAVWTALLLVD
jgi:predicted metal-binding protein